MGNKVLERSFLKALPLAVICVAFLVGGLLGLLFAVLVDGDAAEQLRTYLVDFFALVEEETIVCSAASVVWSHGRWILMGVLGGVTGIGYIILPVLFGIRGFLLGFCICCFARFLGWTGIGYGVFTLGLPALCWMPVFFLSGVNGFAVSLEKAKFIPFGQGRIFKLRSYAILCVLLFGVCVLLECVLLPVLLPVVVRILS